MSEAAGGQGAVSERLGLRAAQVPVLVNASGAAVYSQADNILLDLESGRLYTGLARQYLADNRTLARVRPRLRGSCCSRVWG